MRRSTRRTAALFATSALAAQTLAAAELAQLHPVRDNTLIESPTGGISNGAGSLFAGTTNTGERRRALLQFDLTDTIPSGALVTAATLRLTQDRQGPGGPATLNLHRIGASWGEGSSAGTGGGAPATPGDATWTHRFHDTDLWTTPGGDFEPTILATRTLTGPGNQAFATTPDFVAAVQGWIAAPASNFGLIVKEDASVIGDAARFFSRESVDAATRPLLGVSFERPVHAWNVDADGAWTDGANWQGGAPDSFGTVARFAGVIASPRTVSVPSAVTVGQLELNSPSRYTLAGAGPIQLDNGVGFDTRIDVASGSHTLDTRIVSPSPLVVNVAGASALDVGNLEATMRLVKTGEGALSLGHVLAGELELEAGTVRLGSATAALVSGLSITDGATLDLDHGGLIQSAQPSLVDAELANRLLDISAGRIRTSDGALRVGIARASDLPGLTLFMNRGVPESAVLVRATLAGDTNLDAKVDFDDLLSLAQHYGALQGASWVEGDANGDGRVDFDDLLSLAQQYGSALGFDGAVGADPLLHASFDADWQLARSLAPEPVSTLALIGICIARSRRRVD